MSRIGKQPLPIPDGVDVALKPGRVQVKGPLGELEQNMPDRIEIERDESMLVFTRPSERGTDRALHGLTRTLVANMVEGVTKGYEKTLEIHGVGYRAALAGSAVELALGFSHPVKVDPPDGVTFEVPEQTVVIIKGIDKQKVGQVASDLRAIRPPEPYKGKGIRYRGEHVRRKVGKRA
ncbi:MAG: 50S ribosomal protein L6 [Gaiellaceae bacterium]